MAFKPKAHNKTSDNEGKSDFQVVIPEEGLAPVQVSMIVDLGSHPKQPKFAKGSDGKRELNDDGTFKVLWPKDDTVRGHSVAAYVDLLQQTHEYPEPIGVKNIRLPLHQVVRGASLGLNFTTVAPRDANGNYIKGRPWLLAPTSMWAKIAKVVSNEKGTKIANIIFDPTYENNDLNDIGMLLGRPFMMNVEVDQVEKGDKKYVNIKLKSPVPLAKGFPVDKALTKAISVGFDDDDLLIPDEGLGGSTKFDLIRLADLRTIVLADEYPGSKMQEAVQAKHDESALIADANAIHSKIIESDKDLAEIRQLYPNGKDGGVVKETAPKPAAPSKPQPPIVVEDEEEEGSPF